MTLDIAAIVRAELAKFLKTGDAPTPAPAAVPPAVAKRTLSPEHLAKMQAGRKKKAAEKGKAKADKPAKQKAAKPAKEERVIEGETFEGNGCTLVMQEGSPAKRSGKVYVPMWVNGQFAGSIRADVAREIVNVMRSKAGNDIVAHCELQIGG